LLLIWIKNMLNLILKERNACKLKVIQMKLFLICKDISLLLLKINKFINMQDIYYFKIVLMKTVCLLSAMEQTSITIMNSFSLKQSATFFSGKTKQPFLCLRNMVKCLIIASISRILKLYKFVGALSVKLQSNNIWVLLIS